MAEAALNSRYSSSIRNTLNILSKYLCVILTLSIGVYFTGASYACWPKSEIDAELAQAQELGQKAMDDSENALIAQEAAEALAVAALAFPALAAAAALAEITANLLAIKAAGEAALSIADYADAYDKKKSQCCE